MAPPNLMSACEPIQINNTKNVEPTFNKAKGSVKDVKAVNKTKDDENKILIVWRNVIIFAVLHSAAIYGLWLVITGQLMWKTLLFSYIYMSFCSIGVTGGAHRLWSHKCYKAKLPLRIWLMLWQTASLQNSLHEWVRDHRVHHKYTDTNGDPHNSNRGFFFCHMGWLMTKKHKDVITKGKNVDMSDVEADPVVMWQKKYYVPLTLFLTFVVPSYIPVYFWSESVRVSIFATIFRYTVQLNGTWAVNSAAHLWGYQPYDKSINPRENIWVSMVGYGEGWHNYHHTFPWDYKAAELGNYRLNFTTAFLDFMSYLGLAYELKTVSKEMINKRALRTGDGTRKTFEATEGGKGDSTDQATVEHVWGWDDREMKEEDKRDTDIYCELKDK